MRDDEHLHEGLLYMRTRRSCLADRPDTAALFQVLREHRETLVSVMETFVHDPLCEWTKRNRSSEEAGNPQAKDALRTLEGGLPTPPLPVCTSHSAGCQLTQQGIESKGGTSLHGLLSL